MSQQIPEWFVKQFSTNVYTLSQQKGSKLRPYVRQETQSGKTKSFDRIGAVTPIKKTGRHSNTPQIDTPMSRRTVTLSDYEWADLIDDVDKIRTLNDPTNDYAMAAMWSMGRAQDDEIIKAFGGVALAGEDADQQVSLPDTQRIVPVASSAGKNLSVAALIKISQKFGENEVDESIERHIVVTASQVASLLGETSVTSSDYNTVKALVEGKVEKYMGFTFHHTQRLPKQSGSLAFDTTTGAVGSGGGDANGYRKCYAWAQDGLILSIGQDYKGRISERDDKSYSTQVFASQSVGAVRMEEVKVVEILCNEA